MLIGSQSVKWGALCGVLTVFFMGSVQAEGGRLYACPGNLYTNQLTAQQARELGCQPASPARVSQAQPVHQVVAVAVQPGTSASPAGVAAPAAQPAEPTAPTATASASASPAVTRSASGNGAALAKNVDSATQHARDRDARLIIETELKRTVERLEQMARQAATNQPGHEAAVRRLREDEAALRRELMRLPS